MFSVLLNKKHWYRRRVSDCMKKKSVKFGYSGAKTIYIRKLRFEEAQWKLEKEIQEAFLAGETLIEIVHGIGEGILKKLTLDTIRSHDFLKEVDYSQFGISNPGSTLVEVLGPDKDVLKRYLR
ncbi:Smr domain-containing protein [Leptospira interrogans serovar Linhai str. 56609]|nr:DNA mismatch repair protein [Leptospira interrogans serovar Copenhageni str. Fiocruz L1-130]AJR14317.1 Smr domain-containing protein [Leptospira interrogans serovar Linhai str. 56609]KWV23504.1 DNA mismatch repair protein [Leptospira interrogans]KWV27347.1 DNA mismatch repair protein [Leptospira interrogans]